MNQLEQYFIQNLIHPVDEIDTQYRMLRYGKIYNQEPLTKDELVTVISVGSHYGSVLRTAYWKFVHNGSVEPFLYWDTVIKYFILGGVWNTDFEYIFDMPEAKKLLKKISHPDWVRIGLVGCDWKDLRRECKKFCRYMERLPLQQAD